MATDKISYYFVYAIAFIWMVGFLAKEIKAVINDLIRKDDEVRD